MYKAKKKTGQGSASSSHTTASEEEQGRGTVWLGVQGKEIKITVNDNDETADAYTSKIGGWPVRMAALSLPSAPLTSPPVHPFLPPLLV